MENMYQRFVVEPTWEFYDPYIRFWSGKRVAWITAWITIYHPLLHHELFRLAKNILISNSGRNGETDSDTSSVTLCHIVSHFGPTKTDRQANLSKPESRSSTCSEVWMPNCTPRTGGHNCPVARQINILPLLLATPHFADRCRLYDGPDFWKLYGYGPLWILRLVVTEPKMRPYLCMKLQHNCCFGTRNRCSGTRNNVSFQKRTRHFVPWKPHQCRSLNSFEGSAQNPDALTFFKPSISSEPSLDFSGFRFLWDVGFRWISGPSEQHWRILKMSERCPFSMFQSESPRLWSSRIWVCWRRRRRWRTAAASWSSAASSRTRCGVVRVAARSQTKHVYVDMDQDD